jgi:hypothetical protein
LGNELPRSRAARYQNEFYLINPDAEHRGILLIKKESCSKHKEMAQGITRKLGLACPAVAGSVGSWICAPASLPEADKLQTLPYWNALAFG